MGKVVPINNLENGAKKRHGTPYINFRMRKMIYKFIMENQVEMYSMTAEEKSRYISERIEGIVTDNFWVKDKRKEVNYHGSTTLTTGQLRKAI